jgi:2-C-methyl-D-erythritol 4-phosphate cytidylyltransferase
VKVAILLLAAGRGTRLGADVPKAFLELGGDTLLVHSAARLLAAVPAAERCEVLVLVQPEDRQDLVPSCLERLRAVMPTGVEPRFVDGGATRQESMERGLAATSDDVDLVCVHDAARALVPVAQTRECLRTAQAVGGALLAIPAADTLKRVQDGRVVETVDRSPIWYAQTPQIARRDWLLQAAEKARATGFVVTDDVSLLEHAGLDVAVVPGTAGNLKITRPDDLPLAEALLERDPTPFPEA